MLASRRIVNYVHEFTIQEVESSKKMVIYSNEKSVHYSADIYKGCFRDHEYSIIILNNPAGIPEDFFIRDMHLFDNPAPAQKSDYLKEKVRKAMETSPFIVELNFSPGDFKRNEKIRNSSKFVFVPFAEEKRAVINFSDIILEDFGKRIAIDLLDPRVDSVTEYEIKGTREEYEDFIVSLIATFHYKWKNLNYSTKTKYWRSKSVPLGGEALFKIGISSIRIKAYSPQSQRLFIFNEKQAADFIQKFGHLQ